MTNSREMVKRWNSVKGTRYPFTYNGEDSAVVKTIAKLADRFGDDNVERYSEAMIADESVKDIWVAFNYGKIGRWLGENPVNKPIEVEEHETKGDTAMNNVLGALSEQIVALIGSDMDVIPPIPTTDGTYTLKVTITGGIPVFSWVA